MRIKPSGFSSGFQSCWGVAQPWTDHFSLCQCTEGWSQYFPPPVGCLEISWYKELDFKMYSLLSKVWACYRSKLESLSQSSGSLKTLLWKCLSISFMGKERHLIFSSPLKPWRSQQYPWEEGGTLIQQLISLLPDTAHTAPLLVRCTCTYQGNSC